MTDSQRTHTLAQIEAGGPIDPIWIISGAIKLVEVIAALISGANAQPTWRKRVEARLDALEKLAKLSAEIV